MSEFFLKNQEDRDDYDDTSSDSSSLSQESWNIHVPDLVCQEKSLDEEPLESELANEVSSTKDPDLKGIVSRKGKNPSRSRQRSSTVKVGKGKGNSSQAKKDLEKIEEKEDVLPTDQKDKEKEPSKLGGAEPGDDNNNLQQAEAALEKEVEDHGGRDIDNHA